MAELPLGFDDWLGELLERSAVAASEDVATYIARAVAARLVADLEHIDSPQLGQLLDHLSESPVLAVASTPALARVIADPERLHAVYATGLLDSEPDAAFDRVTSAVAQALDVPFAGLSVLAADRQFLKSVAAAGESARRERELPLELSICPFALLNGSVLAVEDARAHTMLKNVPAVRDGGVVAYLGAPLRDRSGHAVGTLHVTDTKPRLWAAGHIRILSDFAAVVAERIFAPADTHPGQHLS